MAILKVEGVTKTFDSETIIENISLELHEGEIVSLLGVSGGGKTTLFNIIAGLTLPDEGSVWIDDKEITGEPGNVSYMLQKDLLLPYRTILDNVAIPLILRGKKKKEARQTDMFHLPQDDLIEELQNLDVLSVTPMDALNILFRLREKARRL